MAQIPHGQSQDGCSSSSFMMSEEIAPLISGSTTWGTVRTIDPYDRFTAAKKRLIFGIVLWTSVLPSFVSGAFASGFLIISKDLKCNVTTLNYVLGSYIFAKAVSSLFWGVYATFYGRRFVYLISLPLLCLGCLGAALSRTVSELFFSRILQAIGVSSITSTGIAIISDIYRREHRGTAVGILNGNPVPVLAPFLSGVVTSYASWRAMHVILFLMSSLSFIFSIALPETSHPGSRGIDKSFSDASSNHHGIKFSQFVRLNPFKSLALLRIPSILLWALSLTFAWITGIAMWDSLAVTFNSRYGIESPIAVGLCFFPGDIGYVFGSTIAGYVSDKSMIKAQKRRNGAWVPEDRLHEAFLSSLFLVSSSILLAGLTLEYVGGTWGLVLNLVCLFINGFGIAVVQSPAFAYILDILRERSAETKAINNAFENVFSSIVSSTVLPSIDTIGVGWTFAVVAAIGWVGTFILHVMIRYGSRLREGLDYSE